MDTDNRLVKAWGGGVGAGWESSMEEKGDICKTFNNKYFLKETLIFPPLK